MKKKEVKKEVKKVIEYFTDDMHKEIFLFQEGYKSGKGSKPVMKSISLSARKK